MPPGYHQRRPAYFWIVLVVIGMTSRAGAVTHVVDLDDGGDFAAIQPALDAAAAGDTILVDAGTYRGPLNRGLDFRGKAIVLAAAAGPDTTTIDLQGAARAFNFHTAETSAAEVRGFTIRNGAAPSGGAVLTVGASPTIVGCVIIGNTSAGRGGAVAVTGGMPSFQDCALVGNRAGGGGGAIAIRGGAHVTLVGCTICGNHGDNVMSGANGGGVLVTDLGHAEATTTILWGNTAQLGDELFVDGATLASATVDCCDVDVTGIAGPVSLGSQILTGEPHFCAPAYELDHPWADGEYSLTANSPCLPANNACGMLIGSQGEGCGAAVVWTGAAGTEAWEDPLNWRDLVLPGPGDHVEITLGSVRLSSPVSIGWLTMTSEDAVQDTFTVASGGALTLGIGVDKRDPESTIATPVVVLQTNGGVFLPDPKSPMNLPYPGRLFLFGGLIEGLATVYCEGGTEIAAQYTSTIAIPFVQRGDGTRDPPNAFTVHSGATLVSERSLVDDGRVEIETGAVVVNNGEIDVTAGASLTLAGTIENADGGHITLSGDVDGAGTVINQGLLSTTGTNLAVPEATLINLANSGTGTQGALRVVSGSLQLGVLDNSGRVSVSADASLACLSGLTNQFPGRFSGVGVIDAAGAAFMNHGVTSPGYSPGILGYVGAFTMLPDARFAVEIGGTAPGSQYDQLQVSGSAAFTGILDVALIDDFVPQPGDVFTIATFTSNSDAASQRADFGFSCLSGLQLPGDLYLLPVLTPHALRLVTRDSVVANAPPSPQADTFAIDQDLPATLQPLVNDTDPDGDVLRVVRLSLAGTQGRTLLNADFSSLTYVPPPGFAGYDHLVYHVTDCNGATDSAQVTIRIGDTTSRPADERIPPAVQLEAAYPNPFNPTIRLRYSLPQDMPARLTIHGLRGDLVAVLVASTQTAGTHEVAWHGCDVANRPAAAGVYIARLAAAGFVVSRKLELVR